MYSAETRTADHSKLLLLFLLIALYSAFCSQGNLTSDAETRWAVSTSLAQEGSLRLPHDHVTRNFALGADGERYAVWNPGQALLFLPLALCAQFVARFWTNPMLADAAGQFVAASLLLPVLNGLAGVLLAALARQLGFTFRAAALTALAYCLATQQLSGVVHANEEAQVALLLIYAMHRLLNYQRHPGPRAAALYGFVLSAMLVFRSSALMIVLPFALGFFVLLLCRVWESKRWDVLLRDSAAAAAGALPAIAVVAGYNYLRFGSIFEHGYRAAIARRYGIEDMFAAEPVGTALAMLVSPGKGLVWYSPLLLLLPAAIRQWQRRAPLLFWSGSGALLCTVLFHAHFTIWAGDLAWGPRFLTAILPLLVLPLAVIFESPKRSFVQRHTVALLFIVSFTIQLASTAYQVTLEFWQQPYHGPIPSDYTWEVSESHLVHRFLNIKNHLLGTQRLTPYLAPRIPEVADTFPSDPTKIAVAHRLNWFPFKAEAVQSQHIVRLLIAAWVLVALGALAAAARLSLPNRRVAPSPNSGRAGSADIAEVTGTYQSARD